jgi:hypothetical protein
MVPRVRGWRSMNYLDVTRRPWRAEAKLAVKTFQELQTAVSNPGGVGT